jgi:hypothetical protein
MKSGCSWDLRGLHPEARAVARKAACRSGMSVGEWLDGVIRSAVEHEAELRRSGCSDRLQRGYEPGGFYSDDGESDHRRVREPRQQVQAEIDYDERRYDHDQEREWERQAGRPTPNRGEPRAGRSRERQESWERGFAGEDLNREHDRQMSARRRPEAPKQYWAESFADEPERAGEQYYDAPRQPASTGFFGKVRDLIGGFGSKSPRERAQDEPRHQNVQEDQSNRHRSTLKPAAKRERDEQWLEDSGAAEVEPPRRERYRTRPRGPEESGPYGNDHQRVWRRPDAAARRARDKDWLDSSQNDKRDCDSERYREPPRPPRKRTEEEHWLNVGQDSRQRKKSRPIPHGELDEDRFEDLDADDGERYRERYRNPPAAR